LLTYHDLGVAKTLLDYANDHAEARTEAAHANRNLSTLLRDLRRAEGAVGPDDPQALAPVAAALRALQSIVPRNEFRDADINHDIL